MPSLINRISLLTPNYQPLTAWIGHAPFAMWLVSALKPRVMVELGTHFGYSYFAMCQAAVEARVDMRAYAVDTWEGDDHAGFYGGEVYEAVRRENKKFEGFSTLLRKRFNQALKDIKDGSVDLLHIDGRHGYEDVLEDFETWKPKLSSRAVVMFHDTMVKERGFGVYRLWEEIEAKYPTINFTHSHGLGVAFIGPEIEGDVAAFITANADPVKKAMAVRLYQELGDAIRVPRLRAMLEPIVVRVGVSAKDAAGSLDDGLVQTIDAQFTALQAQVANLNRQIAERDRQIMPVAEYRDRLAAVEAMLVSARRAPQRELRRLITYKVLRALSKMSPPLPKSMTKRFARSASKRNPRRPALPQTETEQRTATYQWILETWQSNRRRLAAAIPDRLQTLTDAPKFSVVMPVYNPPVQLLREALESVLRQSYANWELCIADDFSSDPHVHTALKEFAKRDSRIRVVYRTTNGHISAASNSALEIATGEFVALLDHDDTLDQDAFLIMAETIQANPEGCIFYSDEDKIDEAGRQSEPHFKPDFNRDLLYGMNYISHLGVYRTQLLRDVGGFREGFEGAQDYDLLLRCLARCNDNQILHIPKVLYHWRITEGSTATDGLAKPYAIRSSVKALSEHLLAVTGTPIEVIEGPVNSNCVPLWPVPDLAPKVTLIMPLKDQVRVSRTAVESIFQRTNYPNFELLIVDNGSQERETLAWLAEISADPRVRVIRDDGPFNYSALNNAAVARSDGEVLGLVNNDIEVIAPDWLTEMVSLAMRDRTGCVGAKLYYTDGRLQHGGVCIGIGGVAGHMHRFAARNALGYFGRLMLRQNVTAVTGACLVVRRKVYEEVGGLNEKNLKVAFNDVDFCLKVNEAGYHNVWTPRAELYHHESISRGLDTTPEQKARFESEIAYMKKRWRTHEFADPAYNPNLSLDSEDFAFAIPEEL